MDEEAKKNLLCLGISIFSNQCDAVLLVLHGSQILYNLMREMTAL